jgi:hypothetical protein
MQVVLESHLGELPNKRQRTADTAAGSINGENILPPETGEPPFGSGGAKLGLTEVRKGHNKSGFA